MKYNGHKEIKDYDPKGGVYILKQEKQHIFLHYPINKLNTLLFFTSLIVQSYLVDQ